MADGGDDGGGGAARQVRDGYGMRVDISRLAWFGLAL